jgi:hypothetical protein
MLSHSKSFCSILRVHIDHFDVACDVKWAFNLIKTIDTCLNVDSWLLTLIYVSYMFFIAFEGLST